MDTGIEMFWGGHCLEMGRRLHGMVHLTPASAAGVMLKLTVELSVTVSWCGWRQGRGWAFHAGVLKDLRSKNVCGWMKSSSTFRDLARFSQI